MYVIKMKTIIYYFAIFAVTLASMGIIKLYSNPAAPAANIEEVGATDPQSSALLFGPKSKDEIDVPILMYHSILRSSHSGSEYIISEPTLKETLNFFSNKITEGITQDVKRFFEANRMALRQETSIIADYYKTTHQDYAVRCQIRSDNHSLIDLTIAVKSKEQAEAICANWRKQHEDVYMYLMDSLIQ